MAQTIDRSHAAFIIETKLQKADKSFDESSLEEMDLIWEEAKALEAQGNCRDERARPRVVFLDAATYGDISPDASPKPGIAPFIKLPLPAKPRNDCAGHMIAVTNKVVIDKATLNSAEARDLKLIAVAATGTDIIDREQAARRDVKVCNVLRLCDPVGGAVYDGVDARAGDPRWSIWRRGKARGVGEECHFSLLNYPTMELGGKRLGIVGYGNIGQTVAQMARGFGLEVLIAARPGIELEQCERIEFPQINCSAGRHRLAPLSAYTGNATLINEQSLALMKPTAFLINTARGALVDEAAC